MTRAIGVVGVMIITALGSFGQPAPAMPAFEAASVKLAAPSTNATIGRSFGGDAGWLDLGGYDIVATIPHDATEAQLPQSPKERQTEGKSRLAGLCDVLSRTLDRPVVDMTDLQGRLRHDARLGAGR